MMYRRMTAIMTAVLLGSTALLLSACGGQEAAQRPEDEEVETPYAGPEEEAQAQQSAAHGEEGSYELYTSDFVYSAEASVPEGTDPEKMNGLVLTDGRYYTLEAEKDDYGEMTGPYTVLSFDQDGTDPVRYPLEMEGDVHLMTWCFDASGNFYAAVTITTQEEAAPGEDQPDNLDIPLDGIGVVNAGGAGTEYMLLAMNADGGRIWERAIKPSGTSEDTNYYVSSLCASQGRILLSDLGGLSLYNAEDGNYITEIASGAGYAEGDLCASANGTVTLLAYKDDVRVRSTVDAGAGTVSEPQELKKGVLFNGYYAGGASDYLCVSDNGIYTASGAEEPEKVLDFVDSDMLTAQILALAEDPQEAGRFTALARMYDGTAAFLKLTHTAPEEIPDRIVLTLGAYYTDADVRVEAIMFNMESDECRVQIHDYSEYDTNDESSGREKLTEAVLNGTSEDILLIDSGMDFDRLAAAGALADLQPLLQADQEIAGAEYLENIFDLFRKDGKLFAVTPSFTVEMTAGAKSRIGGPGEMTIASLEAAMEQNGVGPDMVMGASSRDSALYYALEYLGTSFADTGTGTCSFDSDGFREILRFVSTFPENFAEEEADETDALRKGRSLLYLGILPSFDEYGYIRQSMFGEEVTMGGYPAAESSGAAATGMMPLALRADCYPREEAWSFLRRFLTEDYQSQIYSAWPVRIQALEDLAAVAQMPYLSEDEAGNIVQQEVYDLVGDEEILRTPLTEAETAQVIAWLGTVRQHTFADTEILGIVFEEADKYFEGSVSLEDCTAQIQKRAQEYLRSR